MADVRTIHFALTSHGLGHVTRSLMIIRALHEKRPTWRMIISSDIDHDWLDFHLGIDASYRQQAYEPGAIQSNSFEVDVPATISAYKRFERSYERLLNAEIEFIRSQRVAAVVSDIPALPVAAASRQGIPAIGVANFTWDWILEPWCRPHEINIVTRLREDYAKGDLQLCLPFGPDRSSFPEWEKSPLVSRKARMPKNEVIKRLELGSAPIAVVCPGGWDANEWPPIHADSGRFQLVTVNNLPITSEMPCRALGHDLPFEMTMPDLIAAADVVLGKPGYGLASECVAHKVPFAMIDRPNFRETPYLESQMSQLGRCTKLTLEDFFSGQWDGFLEKALVEGSDWTELGAAPEKEIATRLLRLIE